MRVAHSFVLALLCACTPSPEKVCAHFQQLDDAHPMANFGALASGRQHGGSKEARCTRRLTELARVDPPAYRSAARCITTATKSEDAWNCWVLDHISSKETAKAAALRKCDDDCNAKKETCLTACADAGHVGDSDACVGRCQDAYSDCAVSCQFE